MANLAVINCSNDQKKRERERENEGGRPIINQIKTSTIELTVQTFDIQG